MRVPPVTLAKVRTLSRVLHEPQWRIVKTALEHYSPKH